jgi:hypothetical protein
MKEREGEGKKDGQMLTVTPSSVSKLFLHHHLFFFFFWGGGHTGV